MGVWKVRAVFLLSIVLALTMLPSSVWISEQVHASGLVSPWTDTDIGSVGLAGSATEAAGGVFTIDGSGADVYNTADAFHYVYQPLSGDGSMIARVLSVQNTSNWAKAGVMIRETLTPGSTQADVIVSPGKGIAFQRRDTTGGAGSNTAGPLATAIWWVKLTRSASTFTAYQSQDGQTWAEIGSDNITMATNVFIGLAVTAHNNSAMCASTIDNVSVNSVPAPSVSETVLLADDFSSGSIDSSKWVAGNLFSGLTDTNVPVAVTNQQLTVGPLVQNASGSHYNGLRSAAAFNFTGAYCYVEVVQPPSSATLGDAMFTIGSDGNDFYRMYLEGANLVIQKRIQGTKTVRLSTPYDATKFKFLRIRHDSSSGNVSFETAPDAGGVPGAWTAKYSEPWNTSWVPLAAIRFEVKAGTWQVESNSPGTVLFDNFRAAAPSSSAPPLNPPQVSSSAVPQNGTAPLTVNFSETASSPNGPIANENWDFGDGQTGTGATLTHTYTASGNFTARVTVTDSAGMTASASTAVAVSPAATGGGGQLKVMQFNIDFTEGTDCIDDANRTATTIANMNPDIVSMAEVWQTNGAQTVANLLTQKTGSNWYVYTAPLAPGAQQVEAIISRLPFVSSSYLYLTAGLVAAQGTVNVNGVDVNYFGTLLDAYSQTNRIAQAAQVEQWASGFSGRNIIGGDFNEWPHDATYATMTAGFTDSWAVAVNAGTAQGYSDNPASFDTRTRRTRIDWVLYSGSVSVKSAQIPDTRNMSGTVCEDIGTTDDLGVRPSDHNPIVVTFTIN
ncbi:MAG: endonuclease/exonuclease/phosphatase family protein [Blastocatellia bacterium]